MFVRNPSKLDIVLAKSNLTDEAALAAVVVECEYDLQADGPVLRTTRIDRRPTDPPDERRIPLWHGCSVTAIGTVHGPRQPPYVRRVEVGVGDVTRALAVFGERGWAGRAPDLTPSEPKPFDTVALVFKNAFGGGYDVPPGLLDGLPHPGFRATYPLNKDGVGFYETAKSAEGAPLPRIEWADHPIQKWNDRPQPAGFAPCPELAGLRAAPPGDEADQLETMLRMQHHAAGPMIFDSPAPGTRVRVTGIGTTGVTFLLPGSPTRVFATIRGQDEEVGFATRSIHVDPEERRAVIVYGHSFQYNPRRAPAHVTVKAAA